MKKKNEIKTYNNLVKERSLLKQIQQLSWNISQIEKRYPFEEIGEEDYAILMETYSYFREDLYRIAKLFKDLEENENKNNKD